MPNPIYWPRNELTATKADAFQQETAEKLARLQRRMTEMQQASTPQPEVPKPQPWSFNRSSLMPWLEGTGDAVHQGVQQAQSAATSLLPSRESLIPWGTPPPAASTTPLSAGSVATAPSAASGVPQAMPSVASAAAPQGGGDLRAYARSVAQQYGVDPDVFERQITQESGFNPRAVSPAGAQGIAQFMPATAQGVGLADPFEPYSALDAAAKHMADNLKRNGGDYSRALAAYNAGQGAVDQYGGVPPYAETQQYIRTILGGASPTAAPSVAGAAAAPAAAMSSPPSPAAGASQDMISIQDRPGRGGVRVIPRSQYNPSYYDPAEWRIVDEHPASPTMQKVGDAQTADDTGGPSAGDQKRQKMGLSGPEQMPGTISGPSDNATDPTMPSDYGSSLRTPGPLPIERQPDHVNDVNTEIRDRLNQQMYRQPLQATGGPDSTTGADQSSNYNDPTADGTLGQPLPSYTGGGPDGGSAVVNPAEPSGGGVASEVAAPTTSPANDPGGAQFAAQDAYSTPQQPTRLPVWDANGNKIGYQQEDAAPPARIHYPNERQLAPAAGSDTGQVHGPDQPTAPPSRWSPDVQAALAGTSANPEPITPPQEQPTGPLQSAASSAGRSQFLNEPSAQQAVDIYSAIQELPFDAYARARQQLVSDSEARRMAGTDPLAPFRNLGIQLPSAEELNPDGRPASDVAAGLLLQGALPDPTDPIVETAFRAAGKTLGLTFRGVRAAGRAAAPAVERGAEAVASAGRGIRGALEGGARAAAYNAAQGGVLGAASESMQADQEGRPVDPGEQARRAVIGGGLAAVAGNRGARAAVGRALGSGFVPRGVAGNIEARLAEASSRVASARQTLDAAESVMARSENGSAAEFNAARRAYTPARRAYDEAARAVESLRAEQRSVGGRMDQAGYGQPIESAGAATSANPREATSPYPGQSAGDIPRTVDDTPRSYSVGSGFVPADEPRPSGLGNVPPSQVNQGGLPGFEQPPKPFDEGVRRPISEDPNAAPTVESALGNARPSQIRTPGLPGMEGQVARRPVPLQEPSGGTLPLPSGRRPGLPGFESIDPLTDPVRSIPPDERALQSQQTMGQALPGMIRDLQRPPVGTVTSSAGQSMLAELAPNPGPIRRVVSAVSDAVAPWANRLNIMRYAGMLSDSATHVFNLTSNGLMQGLDVLTTPVAAALDVGRVAGAKGINRIAGTDLPTARQVFFREVPARIAGMRAGAQVGLRAAADILGTGSVAEDAQRLDQATRGFGTNIPALAPAGSRAAGAVDFAFEYPLRALAASDAVFRSTALGGHLMAEAYAAAAKLNGGKVPTDAMIRAAAQDSEVLARAQNLGARSVLQENRALTQAYQKFLKDSGPLGALVSVEVPFVKTPYNVVAQGVGLTPLGLAGAISDMARGTKSARHIEHTIARAALGTALMAPAAAAYASGEVTGPRPTDPKEISTLPPGWQQWSRKHTVGQTTFYTPLSLEGPLAMPTVLSILMGEAKKKNPGANMMETAGKVALGLGQYAEQASFFQGVANVSQLLDPRTGDSAIGRNLEQVAAQFSPHVVGGGALGREIQRVMGMPMRDPDGMIEALLATHPATAGRVEPRQDVLGRPVVQTGGNPTMRAVSPIARASVENDSAVIRAFRSAKEPLPLVAPKQIPDTSTGETRSLSTAQQHRWRTFFGAALRESWNDEGNPQDAESLQRLRTEARKAANETVLGQR